jgi:hypothetical protein
MAHKQIIVKKYSLRYKILSLAAKSILNMFHLPAPPVKDGVIGYTTLSFALSKDDDLSYLENFIRKISHEIPSEHGFFVWGTTQNALKISPFKYKSYVYLLDWDKQGLCGLLPENSLHVECALL